MSQSQPISANEGSLERRIGGDFFQVLPVKDDSLLIVVGDVSGKGLQAAMNSSTLVGALRNDQKPNAVSIDEYKRLLTEYIAQTRAKGATPLLVTSMNRRTFDANGKITNSLAGYPDAMREVASAQQVALIDLNAMSKTLFEAMGPEGSMKAFMHFPANAFPNQTTAISDDTHFNKYGAYELARCIVRGIREDKLPLRKWLSKDVPDFDPSKPDTEPTFSLPATPIPPKTTDVMKVPQT
jgi:hypothetical protein